MNCTHRAIRSWSELNGKPVPMWTCVDCGAMFELRREMKPLTDPQIHELDWPKTWNYDDVRDFVISVEQAHGIGGKV